MKKLILALVVAAMCLTLPAAAINWGELPCNEEIHVEYTQTCGSFFDVTIVDEGKMYPGWCVQTGVGLFRADSYDACLSKPVGEKWNKVNWILNNKGDASFQEIQGAIWMVCEQDVLFGWDTPKAMALAAAADPTFNTCPAGGIGAVYIEPCTVIGQLIIIEVPCPGDPPEPPVVPEFPTIMVPVFLVGSVFVAASVLKKE